MLTPEVTAARAILKAMDSYDLNPGVLAYILNKAPSAAQNRLLELILQLVEQWCIEYESSEGFRDSEVNRLVTARRIKDALEQYGPDQYQPKH